MNLFKESFTTVRLFVWIFYIGSGLLGIWDVYQHALGFGFDLVWDPLTIAISLIYIIGGLYFVINIRTLLPKKHRQVIQAVTALFLLGIAFSVLSLITTLINPASLDPALYP